MSVVTIWLNFSLWPSNELGVIFPYGLFNRVERKEGYIKYKKLRWASRLRTLIVCFVVVAPFLYSRSRGTHRQVYPTTSAIFIGFLFVVVVVAIFLPFLFLCVSLSRADRIGTTFSAHQFLLLLLLLVDSFKLGAPFLFRHSRKKTGLIFPFFLLLVNETRRRHRSVANCLSCGQYRISTRLPPNLNLAQFNLIFSFCATSQISYKVLLVGAGTLSLCRWS